MGAEGGRATAIPTAVSPTEASHCIPVLALNRISIDIYRHAPCPQYTVWEGITDVPRDVDCTAEVGHGMIITLVFCCMYRYIRMESSLNEARTGQRHPS